MCSSFAYFIAMREQQLREPGGKANFESMVRLRDYLEGCFICLKHHELLYSRISDSL
jgi:hypothetical protein